MHVFAVDCTRNTIAVVHTIEVNFKAVVIPPGHLIWTIYNGLCGTVTISPPMLFYHAILYVNSSSGVTNNSELYL